MPIETAIWATQTLVVLAFIQHSLEHIRSDPLLFAPRLGLCGALLCGLVPDTVALPGLCLIAILQLHRFDGPYNGGSDRMGMLILFCLTAATIAPPIAELALGYLAVQMVLSYAISGWVKIVNPAWRCGRALRDVFTFSAYPVAEDLRDLAHHPHLLWTGSWAVMLFEILFPVALLSQIGLLLALSIGALFHGANACLFGLNRFLWVWVSAYPVLFWFQARILQG